MSKLITTFVSVPDSDKPLFLNSIDEVREQVQEGCYVFFVNLGKDTDKDLKETLGIRSPYKTYKEAYVKAYELLEKYENVSIALVETEITDPDDIPNF